MIDRYSLPEMAALFGDEARFARWLDVELLATEAWSALGVVPAGDAAQLAAAVVKMKHDPESVRTMGINARLYVEKNFAKAVCVRKLEELLEQTLTARATTL